MVIHKGMKEMFYFMTHSNTFYLQLYGAGHMVKIEIAREETCYRHKG